MIIETKFKGQKIRYEKFNDMWECCELDLKAETLSKLEKKITTFFSKEFKDKQIQVLVKGWSQWQICTITSITEDNEIWIKDENGNRSKESSRNVYECSKHNKDCIIRIHGIEKEMDELKKKKRLEEEKMIYYIIQEEKDKE